MKITGTHHVALITANFERMRAFYTETIGLPVVGAFAGGKIIFLQAGPTTIELIGRETYEPSVGGWDHFAFTVEDVDAAYAELRALGVPFHVEPRSVPEPAPEARIAFFKDPDGNILELFQPIGAAYPQGGMA
jgi:glyoxylase I family protein